jgi:phosphate transport system protein
MAKKHIVKSYDDELELLKSKVTAMGSAAEEQIAKAIECLKKRDSGLARETIKADAWVNLLQNEIDGLTVRMLASRQPMAVDLRYIVSALKIATDLERVADYAANIARHVMDLNHVALDKPVASIVTMAQTGREMLKNVMEAYAETDVETAVEVWHRDEEINRRYTDFLSQLRDFMVNDIENTKAYTSLIFVARCCERIGDHIKNVAENVHFIKHGEVYQGEPLF